HPAEGLVHDALGVRVAVVAGGGPPRAVPPPPGGGGAPGGGAQAVPGAGLGRAPAEGGEQLAAGGGGGPPGRGQGAAPPRSGVRAAPLGKRWTTSRRSCGPSSSPRTPRPLSAPRSKARIFLAVGMGRVLVGRYEVRGTNGGGHEQGAGSVRRAVPLLPQVCRAA